MRLVLIIAFLVVSVITIFIAYAHASVPKVLFFEDGQSEMYTGVERYIKDTGSKIKIVPLRIDRDLRDIEKSLSQYRRSYAVGPRTSSQVEKLLSLLEKYEIFAIAPTVTSPAVLGKSNYLLSLATSDEVQVKHIASLLADYNSILVFTDADNPVYCDAFYELLTSYLPTKKITRILVSNIDEMKITSLPTDFDAALFVTEGRKAGMMAQQLRSGGFDGVLVGSDYVYSDVLLQIGSKAVEGMIVYNLFDKASMQKKDFTDMAAAGCYDAMHVVEFLIRQGIEPRLAGEYLVGKTFSVATGSFTINENLWAERKPSFVVVENGNFVNWRGR